MFHIGIDDTDSKEAMCTTYLGAMLKDELAEFSDILALKLVRLNPNIEWKTRGNGSIALVVETVDEKKAKRVVENSVKENAEFGDKNTNPGIVFFHGEIPEEFKTFYYKTLHGTVKIREAEDLAATYGAEIRKFKNGRGIIGALAAIGSNFQDHTHEIIAYRAKDRQGEERNVDRASVVKMDKATRPLTHNNVDYKSGRILITPRSHCPVLFGIRGENEDVLKKAFSMVKTEDKIERMAIFDTNQCTDAHLEDVDKISKVRPFSSVVIRGTVKAPAKRIPGGHVIFSITDDLDEIDCAAYEPTGDFRDIINRLMPGDVVRASGGVKNTVAMTINLEKLEISNLMDLQKEQNPVCEVCGKRMKSAGKNQGFRCKRCKTYKEKKEKVKIERNLTKGVYQVPPRAMRHLSKPLSRLT
ncbi:MAG: DUF1743 domain-containing protein [Candidatus Hydrothermarchaeales archaeon]